LARKKKPIYRRVLLKISGDGFCTPEKRGLDLGEIKKIAGQVYDASKAGVELIIVVGGGNMVRGSALSKNGMNRAAADQMGMIATVLNALALQDALEQLDAPTRVLTAFQISEFAEPFIRRRALRHIEKGRIVICAGGTGNPYFTTDTAAALRAMEVGADVLLKATKVDGVYDSDPTQNPKAKKYSKLSYMQVLNKQLKVMDSTAISLCMDNKLPIIVFNLKQKGNILKAIQGESIGTYVGGQRRGSR